MKYLVIILFCLELSTCASSKRAENLVRNLSYEENANLNNSKQEQPADASTDNNADSNEELVLSMQLFHTEDEEEKKVENPKTVIDKANEKSLQVPANTIIRNSLVLYNFYDKYIYSIYTAPQRVTVLRLGKEEELDGEMVAGDSANWIIETDASAERQLIYIKPLLSNLRTNMVINTTKRSYYLSLESYKDTFMVAVEWRYPMLERKKTTKRSNIIDLPIRLKNLYFGYKLIGYGKDPKWKPNKVFDNGERTFIQFSSKYHAARAPALFVLDASGKSSLINYRVVENYYIVDSLFESAELRLGTKKEDAIRIVRDRLK